MNILSYHIRRTKVNREACNNVDTLFNTIADMPEDEDILSYTDDKGVVHCFEAREVDDLLQRKKNYYTNQELPASFVEELTRYKKSDDYTRSITLTNRTVKPVDETLRKIDEIDELLHKRGLSDSSSGDAYVTVDGFLRSKKYWPWSYKNLDKRAVVDNLYANRNTKVNDWYLVYVVIKYASDQELLHHESTPEDELALAKEYEASYKKVIDNFFPKPDISKLIEACRTGELNSLKMLTINLSASDIRYDKNRMLRVAAVNGRLNILQYLKEEFNLTTDDARAKHNFALIFAAENNHSDVLKYLKEDFGLTAEDARAKDNTALIGAARNGRIEVLRYLKEGFGLTINDARAKHNSAFRFASLHCHIDILRYLIDVFGLTVEDARDEDDYALQVAYKYGHKNVLKFLKEEFGITPDDIKN